MLNFDFQYDKQVYKFNLGGEEHAVEVVLSDIAAAQRMRTGLINLGETLGIMFKDTPEPNFEDFQNVENTIKSKIDEMLGYNVSDKLFAKISPFTTNTKGEPLAFVLISTLFTKIAEDFNNYHSKNQPKKLDVIVDDKKPKTTKTTKPKTTKPKTTKATKTK